MQSVSLAMYHATPFPLGLEKVMADASSDSASDWSGDGEEMETEERGGGRGRG
jgi:hypothetical protein